MPTSPPSEVILSDFPPEQENTIGQKISKACRNSREEFDMESSSFGDVGWDIPHVYPKFAVPATILFGHSWGQIYSWTAVLSGRRRCLKKSVRSSATLWSLGSAGSAMQSIKKADWSERSRFRCSRGILPSSDSRLAPPGSSRPTWRCRTARRRRRPREYRCTREPSPYWPV